MNIQEQVNKILDNHGFLMMERGDVFEAMSEILLLAADHTAEKSPHAHRTVAQYKQVAMNISDMEDFVNKLSTE